jgi:ribonuclease HII
MGVIIGMDEAGYGPNLGPLVVGVTAWRCDGHPADIDLWSALSDSVSQRASRKGDGRLHIADSKDVYTASRGIASLERTALSSLKVLGHSPRSFSELHRLLIQEEPEQEPWFDGADVDLPIAASSSEIEDSANLLSANLKKAGISLEHMRCDVVLTRRFNKLVRDHDSKGIALSLTSVQLLRSIWDVDDSERTCVIADKHGGRNRYDELLDDFVGDHMIFRLQEGRERSVYRVHKTDLTFQTKAEQHLPVALASMVAKYVREVAMELFNRFWLEHIPGLKPTKGYPQDAVRFRKEIEATAAKLGLEEDAWWRSR